MAKPIKTTPVLTGANAKKFNKILEKNKGKKISSEEKEKIKNSYEWLKSIANF